MAFAMICVDLESNSIIFFVVGSLNVMAAPINLLGNPPNPPSPEPVNMVEVNTLIARSNPRLQMWMGLIFTIIIIWLMIFKPF